MDCIQFPHLKYIALKCYPMDYSSWCPLVWVSIKKKKAYASQFVLCSQADLVRSHASLKKRNPLCSATELLLVRSCCPAFCMAAALTQQEWGWEQQHHHTLQLQKWPGGSNFIENWKKHISRSWSKDFLIFALSVSKPAWSSNTVSVGSMLVHLKVFYSFSNVVRLNLLLISAIYLPKAKRILFDMVVNIWWNLTCQWISAYNCSLTWDTG